MKQETDVKTMVEVENVGNGSVSYRLPQNPLIKRKWSKPGAKKKIDLEEIREIISTLGGENLFAENLLIKDIEARKELELPVEEELILDEKAMGGLIKGPLNKLSEVLPQLSETQQKRMAHKAIEMNIDNMSKADILREHTGVNVSRAIQEKKETSTGAKSNQKAT